LAAPRAFTLSLLFLQHCICMHAQEGSWFHLMLRPEASASKRLCSKHQCARFGPWQHSHKPAGKAAGPRGRCKLQGRWQAADDPQPSQSSRHSMLQAVAWHACTPQPARMRAAELSASPVPRSPCGQGRWRHWGAGSRSLPCMCPCAQWPGHSSPVMPQAWSHGVAKMVRQQLTSGITAQVHLMITSRLMSLLDMH
jgi:hypothetical protein